MKSTKVSEDLEEPPKYSFPALLAVLILTSLIAPFIAQKMWGGMIVEILVSLTLAASVYALGGGKRRHIFLMTVLATTVFFLHWYTAFEYSCTVRVIDHMLSMLFYSIVVVIMARRVFTVRHADGNVIIGTICIYLIASLVFTTAYSLIETVEPGSFAADFRLPDHHCEFDYQKVLHANLTYFSLVTMSTLGYGDITPLAPVAKSIAALEAVAGQFYIAILVARLIGLYLKNDD